MMKRFFTKFELSVTGLKDASEYIEKNSIYILASLIIFVSLISYFVFSVNGLALSYNDARSHLNIGRRVVESITPGLAQVGSVWLPLPHLLMTPTVWLDFMWKSGMSGAMQSMVAFVLTAILIYKFLKELKVGLLGRMLGVFIFISNLNVLYLQSTAMTELLLIFTMTAGTFYLLKWHKDANALNLIKSAFFIMLSTLVRYDGWFLLVAASGLVLINSVYTELKKSRSLRKAYQKAEGNMLLFSTLGGLGIFGWLVWNYVIFGDPLYFAFGEFSAHAQQTQLEAAGDLDTKHNIWLSLKVYLLAFVYNIGTYPIALSVLGIVYFLLSKAKLQVKLAGLVLLAPLMFNILALYLGHSTIFVQGISGNTWFNIRYGILVIPAVAIFAAYFIDRLKNLKLAVAGVLVFVVLFSFASTDAVTIEDARFGSSQKNVTEISSWLRQNVSQKKGYILVSVASHDAIVFDSGMSMRRYIHEGTGIYWQGAIETPDRYARWIIVRTNDEKDLVWKNVSHTIGFDRYILVRSFPFADIYELDNDYLQDYFQNLPSVGLETEIK